MKKAIALILTVLFMFGAVACAYKPLKISGAQDTTYAVTSNGGMAVQYGNYIYFVNGYRPYEDADGSNNVWGDVVQGGIVRAELISGGRTDLTVNGQTFVGGGFVMDQSGELSLAHSKNQPNPLYYFNDDGQPIDENDEVIEEEPEEQPFFIDIASVQQIVPKNIAPDSKNGGGIFIYDNWIYYASRNNQRDKNGDYQYERYDFFRTKTDGKGTQKIYTSAADATNIEYSFYKYNGKTYLTVFEGVRIVSIGMTDKKVGGRKDRNIIAEKASSVIFPDRETYFSGINTNTINDYIIFTREAEKGETPASGTVLEVMRPDGSERSIVYSNSSSISLTSVNSDSVYFTDTRGGASALLRLDLNLIINNTDSSKTAVTEEALPSTSGLTDIYPFRSSNGMGETSTIFTAGNKLQYRLTKMSTPITLVDASVTFVKIEGGYIYFTMSDNSLCRTTFESSADKKAKWDGMDYQTISKHILSSSTFFKADIAGGHVFYLVKTHYAEWAEEYVYAKRISVNNAEREIFVGVIEKENPLIATHAGHLDDDGNEKHVNEGVYKG